MKKTVSLLFLLFLTYSAFSQKFTKNDSLRLAKTAFIYNLSKQYNDPLVARMALYLLVSEDPRNVSLRDSLAFMYFERQMYPSAALVSQDNLVLAPDNLFATEIAAISFEQLGVRNKALKYYEKLYLNESDNIQHLYKMASLQQELKLNEEALTSIELLLSHKNTPKSALYFMTSDNQQQEIPMKLATQRLKAMVHLDKGEIKEAKGIFENILKEKPDFELIKTQLKELTEKKVQK